MKKRKRIHFEISERKLLLRLVDIVAVLSLLCLLSRFFHFDYFDISQENFHWTIVFGIYLTVLGTVFEMYNLQVSSNPYQIAKSIVLTTSSTVLFYLLTPIYTPALPHNRMQIVYFYFAIFFALLAWRLFYLKFLASGRFIKKVVLVCDCDQAAELVGDLEKADPHFKVLGYVNTDSACAAKDHSVPEINPDKLEKFVRKNHIAEIVIASQKTDGITVNLYNQLIHLLESGYIIREYTQVYEQIMQRIPVQYVNRDFYRYFPFSRSNQNHLYLLMVRVLEIMGSLLGIAIGIALLPLILIGNAIANRGPLFYTQKRVGRNGHVFEIIKFRTMIKNAEKDGARFATSKDHRITKFGNFLRKTRIDEFPQFINILKGEMSVIGPRPERPVFVQKIAEVMPFYETRHVIKPGLTGWAQVNYSYGATLEDGLVKLQYDLYYIKHRSIFLDINILVKTFSTVLFYRGQ